VYRNCPGRPGGARRRPKGMRCCWLTTLGIACAVIARPAAAQAQTDPSRSPVSLERIRAALAQPPPRLVVPAPSLEVPTFRVEITTQDLWNPAPLDEPAFDPTWGLPSAGELLMGGIGKIGSAVGGYKRKRAKGRARKEVDDALAAFCAVHECPVPARP
jgi:hypothetical protein